MFILFSLMQSFQPLNFTFLDYHFSLFTCMLFHLFCKFLLHQLCLKIFLSHLLLKLIDFLLKQLFFLYHDFYVKSKGVNLITIHLNHLILVLKLRDLTFVIFLYFEYFINYFFDCLVPLVFFNQHINFMINFSLII